MDFDNYDVEEHTDIWGNTYYEAYVDGKRVRVEPKSEFITGKTYYDCNYDGKDFTAEPCINRDGFQDVQLNVDDDFFSDSSDTDDSDYSYSGGYGGGGYSGGYSRSSYSDGKASSSFLSDHLIPSLVVVIFAALSVVAWCGTIKFSFEDNEIKMLISAIVAIFCSGLYMIIAANTGDTSKPDYWSMFFKACISYAVSCVALLAFTGPITEIVVLLAWAAISFLLGVIPSFAVGGIGYQLVCSRKKEKAKA